MRKFPFRIELIIIVVWCLVVFNPVFAAERSVEEAQAIAQELIQAHIDAHGDWGGASSAYPGQVDILEQGGNRLGYFILVQPTGYVMVVADDRLYPIRSYDVGGRLQQSEVLSATENRQPAGDTSKIKNFLTEDIKRSLQPSKTPRDMNIASKASSEQSATPSAASDVLVLDPLTSSAWHQHAPFNAQLPLINGEPASAGCGPVAVAQLMNFWKSPKGIVKKHSYEWNGTTVKIVDTSPYDWDKIKDDYGYFGIGEPQEIDAVARLIRHVAITMETEFSSEESSNWSGSEVEALKTFFDYSEDIEMVYREDMTAEVLMREVILPELQKGQPCLYEIYTDSYWAGGLGHITVADGYERIGDAGELEFIHLNFGWGNIFGTNSWYRPDSVKAADYSFSYLPDQRIIRNIRPFDRKNWTSKITEQGQSITAIQTDRFTAMGIDANRILVVHDLNPELNSNSNWGQSIVDISKHTVSDSVPLDISTSFIFDPPTVLRINNNAYALVWTDGAYVDFQVRAYDGTLWNLSNSQVPYSIYSRYDATYYKGNLVIAGVRSNTQPCLYVYHLTGDVGKTVDLGSLSSGTVNNVMITPLNNGTLLAVFYVDDTINAYIIGGDTELSVISTAQIELPEANFYASGLKCYAVKGGFILAWAHDIKQKLQALTFDYTASPVENLTTLKAYHGLYSSGMSFDLDPTSGDQFVLAVDDQGHCLLQLYDLSLDRMGYPVEFSTDSYDESKAQAVELGLGKFAVLWVTKAEGSSNPGYIGYVSFKTSQKVSPIIPVLNLLLD